MLAGMQQEADTMFTEGDGGMGESMFKNMAGAAYGPEPKELEDEALRAQYNKHVEFKSYHVKTFDLSDHSIIDEYRGLMRELFMGAQAKTHVVFVSERRFVETGDNPRWLAHMEWAVFELDIQGNPTVPPADSRGDATDGQAGN